MFKKIGDIQPIVCLNLQDDVNPEQVKKALEETKEEVKVSEKAIATLETEDKKKE